jgi:hypothetical protein
MQKLWTLKPSRLLTRGDHQLEEKVGLTMTGGRESKQTGSQTVESLIPGHRAGQASPGRGVRARVSRWLPG